VINNNVTQNFDGIELLDSSGNNVTSNNASANSANGIELDGSNRNNVTKNDANDNLADGISLFSSNNNDIIDNNATGNDNNANGIALTRSSGNNVTDNNASANDNGISLVDSSNNNLTANTANANIQRGLRLLSSSDNNNFIDNTARENGLADFKIGDSSNNVVENLDIGASTAPNTTLDFTGNNFRLSGISSPPADPSGERNISRFVDATNTSASGSFLNITFQYTDGDVSGVDESSLDVWKNSTTWTELGGTVDTVNNKIQYNITNFGSVFAPLAGTSVSGAPGADAGGDCINRRNIGRGQEGQECPRDRGLGRGGSREELDRETGRNSDTARRDRGRGERGGRSR
jgi:parallel beta-helix repeat protein